MLLYNGEIGEPCGTPTFVGITCPLSYTPTVSVCLISFSRLPSAIRLVISFQGDPGGITSPADFLPGRQRLRLGLIRCRSQGPPGTRQDLPAYDVKHSQRAAPHTPAPEERFVCPFIPAPCQPSQCDDTVGRCSAVLRGYCGFTGVAARCFAFPVQGHLSL